MQRDLFTRFGSAAYVRVRLHYPPASGAGAWIGMWHKWEMGDLWATVAKLEAMGIRVETLPQ